jgi:hypothetical protein
MKSSLRAALALGALALASSQASASSISVYSGMSPVPVKTSNILPTLDPRFFELDVSTPGMLTRLIDTSPDADPNPSWMVSYQIWTDTQVGAGYTLGSLVDSFSFTDANFSTTNPSAWHLTGIALAGEYVLRIATSGADSSTSQISAVPLPAAAWLFGSALMGFGALRRKQKLGEKSEMAAA